VAVDSDATKTYPPLLPFPAEAINKIRRQQFLYQEGAVVQFYQAIGYGGPERFSEAT
jgi:hypothetical protein